MSIVDTINDMTRKDLKRTLELVESEFQKRKIVDVRNMTTEELGDFIKLANTKLDELRPKTKPGSYTQSLCNGYVTRYSVIVDDGSGREVEIMLEQEACSRPTYLGYIDERGKKHIGGFPVVSDEILDAMGVGLF